jgi:hypothetical protein
MNTNDQPIEGYLEELRSTLKPIMDYGYSLAAALDEKEKLEKEKQSGQSEK